MCLSKTCLALLHNLVQSLLLSLSPSLSLSLLSLGPALSSLCLHSLAPPPSSRFCCMICRYISPRGAQRFLPSVWGDAAHLWRPQLSAQSLLLFLYLLPNPAAHLSPSSLHTPGLCVLTPPSLPVPAQPHPVGPAQSFSTCTQPAPSSPAPQHPILLLNTHAL